MDKEFEKWAKEFEKDWRDWNSLKVLTETNQRGLGKELFTFFMQHKSHKQLVWWTMWLVIGTWILAIATILLVKFG